MFRSSTVEQARNRFQNWVQTAQQNSWKQIKDYLEGIKTIEAFDEPARLFLLDAAWDIFETLRYECQDKAYKTDEEKDSFMNLEMRRCFNEIRYGIYLREMLLKGLQDKEQNDMILYDINHFQNIALKNIEVQNFHQLIQEINKRLKLHKIQFMNENEFLAKNKFMPKKDKLSSDSSMGDLLKPLVQVSTMLKNNPEEAQRKLPEMMPKMIVSLLKAFFGLFLPQESIKEMTQKAKETFQNVTEQVGVDQVVNVAKKKRAGKEHADSSVLSSTKDLLPAFANSKKKTNSSPEPTKSGIKITFKK